MTNAQWALIVAAAITLGFGLGWSWWYLILL